MSNPAFGSNKRVDPELPLTEEGVAYHLGCSGKDLADRIILVGDPNRVEFVAGFFDAGSVKFRSQHREIHIATGTYKGSPVTVLSTGMGTDNVEIVINEIHALKEYDFKCHEWRPRVGEEAKAGGPEVFDPSTIKLIRVGTCGSPHPGMPVAALAITRHAIGMDNTCVYYKATKTQQSKDLEEVLRVTKGKTGLGAVDVYATEAHPNVTKSIVQACEERNKGTEQKQPYMVGTTASASGFYGCQGRSVGRLRQFVMVPNMVEELSKLSFNVSEGPESVVNIEMETSALCYLSGLLGYQAGTVCVVLATRAGDVRHFATPEELKVGLVNGIYVALDAVVEMK